MVFGAVRVPVKLYSATESRAIQFRERHLSDGAAIEHRRVCLKEDREIPYSELVKGFEVSEGRYVALTKEEVAAVDGPTAHVIAIEHFVEERQIDPLYFERAYYLGPGDASAEVYLVLQAALRRTGMVGIGRFVFHNTARLVGMRALGGVIGLHTMRFHDEVRSQEELREDDSALPADGEPAEVGKRELATAGLLIDSLASKFEPHKYRDKHREALLALIERKARGEAIEAPQPEPATDADRLLEALEASLAKTPTARSRPGSGSDADGPGKSERKKAAPRRGRSGKVGAGAGKGSR